MEETYFLKECYVSLPFVLIEYEAFLHTLSTSASTRAQSPRLYRKTQSTVKAFFLLHRRAAALALLWRRTRWIFFIRCCFLTHYRFRRLCPLMPLKCVGLNDQQHFTCDKICLTCLSVTLCIGLTDVWRKHLSLFILLYCILVLLWMCNYRLKLWSVSYLRCKTIGTRVLTRFGSLFRPVRMFL